MASTTHSTPYSSRSSSHPLSAYLYKLMLHKSSNLCLSADVSSASELLALADQTGPSIVVFKTHYDLLAGWDSNAQTGTGPKLAQLARKHGFLIFEDRKFSDIGSTVQKQYTSGPAGIVEWAHITNAHILPGAAIVTALSEAASQWREKKRYEVKTDITVGTPRPESEASDHGEDELAVEKNLEEERLRAGRKASIVSVTTVSQHFEDASTSRHNRSSCPNGDEAVFPGIEEPPLERALLLLAQMSSAGNLLDAAYAQACVKIARDHKDFVMGYIAQESLNSQPEDDFITMTPGCQLPPEGESVVRGDGMGQQYNTPSKLVTQSGTDVIIVGRGIIKAADPVIEAERYRKAGWEAYLERVGGK